MSRKYKLWDKVSPVRTPGGRIVSAEEWMDTYASYCAGDAQPVISASLFDGALINELSIMKQEAENNGAVFDVALAEEDLLLAIENWEDQNMRENLERDATHVSAEERIAAAMEYQNLMSL